MADDADILTPDAERARQNLEAIGTPAPSAAFRARLQREFVAGTITSPEREIPLGRLPGHGTAVTPHPAPSRVHPLPVRRPWMRMAPWAVAAAAALVVVSVAGRLNAGAPWRLGAVTGEGVAIVDERPIPINHHQELEQALTPGARVRVPPGCDVAIVSARTIVIHMTSETNAIVPAVPGRWFGRNVSGQVDSGEWRIMTGPAFGGAHLAIATPATHVMVTGTTLAVICEPPGTCVCVYEGSVKVGRDPSSMVSVEEGRRRYVFMDPSRPMENDVMRPSEATALAAMHDQMDSELGGE
jgi:ferric-dicitrate binding protein FerR (iron transport regulator)